MGCTCKSSAPPQSTPVSSTAAAQGAANRDTATAQTRLNQTDEYTPYGSSVYSPTGGKVDGVQRFRRDITLSPEQQSLQDKETAISNQLNSLASGQIGRVESSLADPVSYEGMPSAPTADSAARQQTIDALYGQAQSRLDPRFSGRREQLAADLANQGIGVGSKAYTGAFESEGRTENDAYNTALNQAIVGGGAEQSRLFGLQGNERERAIQEAAHLRGIPLNDMAALMGTSAGVTAPQFSAAPQTSIAGTDIAGLTAASDQNRMNAWQQGENTRNSAMGGLFGLVGSGLGGWAGNKNNKMFSDRRVKENISKVGTLDNGLDVYSFRYKAGGPQQIGLMAQDVEKVNPDAVGEFNGIKMVDYAEAVL